MSKPQPTASLSSYDVWHSRLGHASHSVIDQVLRQFHIKFSSGKSASKCPSCCVSKSHKLAFLDSTFVASRPLELICSDLWGPSFITSTLGNKYYVLFFYYFMQILLDLFP